VATFGFGPLPELPVDQLGELAARTEELGFDAAWIPDERFFREVSVALAGIAASTSGLRIGTAVTDPFIRHPALTAQWAASVDEVSGGRMHVGIGAGIAGFEALGIERQRPAVAIREMVEVMRHLWNGRRLEYRGEVVRLEECGLDFEPLRPDIPCYIAGRGPLILSLAGEIGDGVIVGSLASEPLLDYALGRVDSGLESAGRSRDEIEVAIWLHTAVHSDGAAARRAVADIVVGILLSSLPILDKLDVPLPAHLRESLADVRYEHGSPEIRRIAADLDDELIDHFAVAGSPEYVVDRLRALEHAGIEHFALKPWTVPGQTLEDQAAVIAREVMPAFAEEAP